MTDNHDALVAGSQLKSEWSDDIQDLLTPGGGMRWANKFVAKMDEAIATARREGYEAGQMFATAEVTGVSDVPPQNTPVGIDIGPRPHFSTGQTRPCLRLSDQSALEMALPVSVPLGQRFFELLAAETDPLEALRVGMEARAKTD